MKLKLIQMSEIEQTVDKQVMEILGRAIDGKDLQMMYDLDLKTLNQMNNGTNAKLDGFVKHFVSIHI